SGPDPARPKNGPPSRSGPVDPRSSGAQIAYPLASKKYRGLRLRDRLSIILPTKKKTQATVLPSWEKHMRHKLLTAAAMAFLVFTGAAVAQPAQPPFATRKIEGTDNVYLFRYQGHQSMFIVTPKGVIATDPIGRYRPEPVT